MQPDCCNTNKAEKVCRFFQLVKVILIEKLTKLEYKLISEISQISNRS